MQLRRSLSTTAVAAMVSSVALFAAPAAMAAGSTNSTAPSGTASSTAAPKGEADKPGAGAKSTAPTTAAPTAGKGDADVPPVLVGGGAVSEGISAKVNGFPGKLVGGAKATPFSTTITNQGKKSLALAPGFQFWNADKSLKASHIVLEYLDGNTWKRAQLGDEDGAVGGFLAMDGEYVETPYQVAAGKSVTIQLRIAVTKDAPLGKNLGFNATVGFLGEEEEGSAFALSDTFGFLIAKADSPGGTPGTPGTKPKPQPKPKPKPGTVKPGKELAATGADDSNTPVLIGAAAGTALVVGAGFVVIARRRRNGASA
ncbi:LPXTG cell wall anchor domain-containing protein [Embleya sp. NBC_00888]|uniref:LPXTG cell wall anchor domain-containing protein n=1 Tax=Embleya sp. NBC_00888 TaxID=2975960 RepID=UPI003862E47E|nr:LPXTG cell wall anchor domain-containing protein [Embleya sp. NBC_00888]